MYDTDYQTFTFRRPKFQQVLGWKIFKNIHPKTPGNDFLAVYLCINGKSFVKTLLIDNLSKLCFYGILRTVVA